MLLRPGHDMSRDRRGGNRRTPFTTCERLEFSGSGFGLSITGRWLFDI
jgi:hypothetical protein